MNCLRLIVIYGVKKISYWGNVHVETLSSWVQVVKIYKNLNIFEIIFGPECVGR